MRDGDLFQKLQRTHSRRQNLPEETIWSIFIQISEALKALHDHKIIHRVSLFNMDPHMDPSLTTLSASQPPCVSPPK